jgi:transposase-like protein
VDETYVRVNGVWRYVYRAVDQHGQVIDVLISARHDAQAARRFFRRALSTLKVTPTEVVTDAAAVYPQCSTSWSRRRGTMPSGTPTEGHLPSRSDADGKNR